jgi:hypothetical protein
MPKPSQMDWVGSIGKSHLRDRLISEKLTGANPGVSGETGDGQMGSKPGPRF